jgi:multidrug resistance efflux pump
MGDGSSGRRECTQLRAGAPSGTLAGRAEVGVLPVTDSTWAVVPVCRRRRTSIPTRPGASALPTQQLRALLCWSVPPHPSTRSLRHCMTTPVRGGRTRGRHWVLVGVLLVLAGLSAWGVLARVPVSVVALHTPLTLDPALQVVMTPVAGQVRVTYLQVGREVEAGDVLVALDSTAQRLQLEAAQQHLGALEAHRTARRQEGAALEAAWQATAQAAQAAQAEAQSRHDDAVRAFQGAQEKVHRLGPLSPLADLQAHKTAVETTHRSLQQLAQAQQVQAAEWGVRLAQHQREMVVLEGDLAVATARLAQHAAALESTTLRAARAGRLGAVAALLPGTVVQAGAWLGILGPRGPFLVTVEVPPAVAGGRLRAGQPAWLRVLSATERPTGALAATVTQVAETSPDTPIRVVLRLSPEMLAQWPLEPLAVGTVVIEVGQQAPITRALRTLAQALWDHPRTPPVPVLPATGP